MNCPNCHSSVDYRFATSCLSCNCQLVQAMTPSNLISCNHHPPGLKECIAGAAMILVTVVTATCIGAAVVYMLAGTIYVAIYPHGVTNSYECARGMLVGWLSLIGGAFLGCSGGAILAARLLLSNQVRR